MFNLLWSRGDRLQISPKGMVTLKLQESDGTIGTVKLGKVIEVTVDEIKNGHREVPSVSGARVRKFELTGQSTIKMTLELDTRPSRK